ncbi:formimidoylglutamase [Salegentibacter agarivorans]|jgi:arginase family enzyme|uniref:formimidoylglutamase n=1 Tax=unclassified Salegentibacter TaxID=2633436 RepID=UPI00094A3ACB|nr:MULTISPECIES: formimidoylglutamase [unclassified Salegentibacter]APS38496.1 arginase [Salegentibacter sp. T436]MBO2544014.1 formimidoylglutamase [Salegentibacter sp. BDJ18]|tara:strand:- start:1294 stop:2454 length:1161 start_codon:yes stop_codon:yes gene_type:complete
MDLDFLSPLSEELLREIAGFGEHSLGNSVKKHTASHGLPDLDGVQMAVVGIKENRLGEEIDFLDFVDVRKAFYSLFPGNWHINIADLGDIEKGETVEDTYFAVQTLVAQLVKKDLIPVLLGGSQDLVYAQYRAYDTLDQMVNLVNIDSRFDLGDAENPIGNRSYVGKIVVNQPYNLFNYSNIGYQTYFNSQDEIELMERLFFDAYRLGEVSNNIKLVEPVMRDANMVAIDLAAVSAPSSGSRDIASPNGFDGKEICALSRYAGISDKVSSFGIYEYDNLKFGNLGAMLMAQMMWYFAEGVNYRTNENTISAKKEFIKYQVPIDDEVLVFYKSPVSGRWWIEIPFLEHVDTKLKRSTLLPCSEEDYLEACNQVIPERWYKAKRKNEV